MFGRVSGFVLVITAVIGSAAAEPVRPTASFQLAQTDQAEIAFWNSVKDTNDPAELKAYLGAYPTGKFAPLAEIRLNKLRPKKGDDGSVGSQPPNTATSASTPSNLPPPPPSQTRGWTGLEVRDLTAERRQALGVTDQKGIEIVSTVAYGPSAKSGLKAGDLVLTVNGEAVTDIRHMISLTGSQRPGGVLEVEILRNGARNTLTVQVGDYFKDHWAAAHNGDVNAMVGLGTLYSQGTLIDKDHREAVGWFRRGAEAGSLSAMRTLGRSYQFGFGVDRDDQEAVKWYGKAAREGAGDTEAMFALGLFYNRGQGIERDYQEAARWFKAAADRGHAGATHNYGSMLSDGHGVAKDEAQAVDWYRRAARLGQPLSYTLLGLAYYEGKGVSKNDKEAVRWFREAEKLGEPGAMNWLAVMHEHGEGGLEKSRSKAISLYRRAAAGDEQSAMDRLNELKVSVYDPAELQRLLTELGFDPGPIDGRLGSKTTEAIRAYQTKRGLNVDGKVSLPLMALLRQALKEKDTLWSAGTESAKPVSPDGGGTPIVPGDLEKLD